MATSMKVVSLRCNSLVNPLGLGEAGRRPLLSWALEDARRGARQTAWQAQAAGSLADLSAGRALLWDSGRVTGDQTLHVPWGGAALASRQRVVWRVRAWDHAGEPSDWSDAATFELGLLDRGEWKASWIQTDLCGSRRTLGPAPNLRRPFRLPAAVESARLYVTALGLYEARINGRRVGDFELAPGWTDYAKRVQYQVYDVAALLQAGENVLGAVLGDGWYCGHVGAMPRQFYGDRPRLLAQLEIACADGSKHTIVSDASWKFSAGGLLGNDMIMGESFDARLEPRGWDAPGFDDAGWRGAQRFDAPPIELSAMQGPPVRAVRELLPVGEPTRYTAGWGREAFLFDFGQNISGRVRLRVKGPAGLVISLRHGEVLDASGKLYTANLRTALATDHYTLRGDADGETWEPRFTFHGFRYAELIPEQEFGGMGASEAKRPTLDRDSAVAVVLCSDMAPTGEFECSEPLVSQLQRNIQWGQRGNFIDVPTDCPQRDERLGWTGDAQVFARTAAYNFDVAGFFAKWNLDLADAQREDGGVPPVIPSVDRNSGDAGPAWADAAVIIPWTLWRCYGDVAMLRRDWPVMERYMRFMLEKRCKDGIRSHPEVDGWGGFGDWLAMDISPNNVNGRTNKDLIGTAFLAYDARLMSQAATALGDEASARRYAALFESTRQAFCRRFVTGDGLIVSQSQTSCVLALHFDLLPEALRPAALDWLVKDIRGRGMHLSTGFVGSPYLLPVLSRFDRLDVAYALLMQKTWPSWLYPVTQGATTIWERWDGWTHDRGFADAGMNSFNHYAYGSVGQWLYCIAAGLDQAEDSTGYRRLEIRPRPGGPFTSAAARLRTPLGLAESSWRIEGGTFTLDVRVPANATARITMPCADAAEVREGGRPASESKDLRVAGDGARYEVAAGAYRFSCPWTSPKPAP